MKKKILVLMTAIIFVVSAYMNPTMAQVSDLQTEYWIYNKYGCTNPKWE